MTNKATKQIIEQLQDSSHPPIVLLDGAWGIGKTYLVDHELRPQIKLNRTIFGDYHYISVFGVKSVTEFQDQVVSLYISNLKEGSAYLDKMAKYSGKLAQLCGATASEAGLIQGVVSGTTGYLRQNALQNLEHMTIVVDDLERLTDEKLISDIMGTCLRFAEHNQIKIIVLANASAFQDKSKIEKSFSDIIRLSRTTEELMTIISEIYKDKLDPAVEEAFFKSIDHAQSHKLKIGNLRVLQRAMNRVLKLAHRIQSINKTNTRKSIDKITMHIVAITLYCYTNNLDMEAFNSIVGNKEKWRELRLASAIAERTKAEKTSSSLSNSEQKQKDLFDQLTSVLNGFDVSKALVDYCFTNLIPDVNDDELIEQFELPRLTHPVDVFLAHTFYSFTTEEEFEKGVSQLESLLFASTAVDWSSWITCCDNYLFLHEKGYIEEADYKDLSLKLQQRLLEDGVIDLDTVMQFDFSYSRRLTSDELVTENFNRAIETLNQRAKDSYMESVVNNFLKDWRGTVYQPQYNIQYEPFFHRFDCEKFAQAITQWTTMEVAEFIGFLNNRYRVINDTEKEKIERPILITLAKLLADKRPNLSGRLRKGVLNELVMKLDETVSNIDEKLKQ